MSHKFLTRNIQQNVHCDFTLLTMIIIAIISLLTSPEPPELPNNGILLLIFAFHSVTRCLFLEQINVLFEQPFVYSACIHTFHLMVLKLCLVSQ